MATDITGYPQNLIRGSLAKQSDGKNNASRKGEIIAA